MWKRSSSVSADPREDEVRARESEEMPAWEESRESCLVIARPLAAVEVVAAPARVAEDEEGRVPVADRVVGRVEVKAEAGVVVVLEDLALVAGFFPFSFFSFITLGNIRRRPVGARL